MILVSEYKLNHIYTALSVLNIGLIKQQLDTSGLKWHIIINLEGNSLSAVSAM